ncbi:MAG: autotransporter domain-containing protein, partial [Aphanocapsa feldmannii 277cV]
IDEGDSDETYESLTVSGSSSRDNVTFTASTTLTITDNDDPPSGIKLTLLNDLDGGDLDSLLESAGSTTVQVKADLEGEEGKDRTTYATAQTLTVTVGADDDTAIKGTDYTTNLTNNLPPFSIDIPAGELSRTTTFMLMLNDDNIDEGDSDETYESLTVSGSSNLADVSVREDSLTIIDNDAAPSRIKLTLLNDSDGDLFTVPESVGSTTVKVKADLKGDEGKDPTTYATAQTLTVTVGADDDTAIEGIDYEKIDEDVNPITITIRAGKLFGTETFTLTPKSDSVIEEDETLTILGNIPTEVPIEDTSLTIIDDTIDVQPSFGNNRIDGQIFTYTENLEIEQLVLPEASGGNGELRYTLTPLKPDSTPALPEGLDYNEEERTITGTPKLYHRKTKYTWTAIDEDGDTTSLTFSIKVDLASVEKEAIRSALSGQARALLGSVTEMIGSRLDSASGGTGSTSSICVSPAAAAAGNPGDDTITAAHGIATANAWQGNSGKAGPDGMGLRGVPHVGHAASDDSMDKTFDDLLSLFRGQPHSLQPSEWGLGCGDATAGDIHKRWTLWGAADLQWAKGSTESSTFDGAWEFLYFGADRAFSERWLGGLSLSRVWGEVDYSFDDASSSGGGQLSSSLTALYPYLHGQLSPNLELSLIAGIGVGDVGNVREHVGGHRDQGDLDMSLVSVGLRRSLTPTGDVDLSFLGDTGFSSLSTEGDGSLDNVEVSVVRSRIGLELSRPFASGAEPFARLYGRYDSGDGPSGTAAEMVLGLRYGGERLDLEVRGNYLSSAADFEQWGANARLDYGAAADGAGLNLSLTSQWGVTEKGGSFLQGPIIGLKAPGVELVGRGDVSPVQLSGEVGYGLPMGEGQRWGILTPTIGYDHSEAGTSRTRLGLAYNLSSDRNRDIELRLDLIRSEGGQKDPDHSIELGTSLRF